MPPYHNSDQNPIRIYFELNTSSVGDQNFNLSEANPSIEDRSLQFLIRTLNDLFEEEKAVGTDSTISSEILYYAEDESIMEHGILANRRNSSHESQLTWYSWFAFSDLIRSWKSIRIVGALNIENGEIIYLKPELFDGSEGAIQAIGVIDDGGDFKLVEPQQLSSTALILRSTVVLDFLQEEYQ